MTDLLDKPVGDFEWGPEKRRLLSPWLAIIAGTIIMVAGFALTGLSRQSSTTATPDRATQAIVPTTGVAPSEPAAAGAQQQPQPSAQQQAQPQPPEAAGGVLSDADLDGLNLAASLDDGAPIHVPPLAPDRSNTTADQSTAIAEVTVEALSVTSPTPPTELWGPDEPAPVPPEIEALMADRETAPDPVAIDDLLVDAGLDPPPPDT